MTKVMDAAADGDTVFLSSGYFQGDFIMTKKLAFIGSGADSGKDGTTVHVTKVRLLSNYQKRLN